MTSRLVALCFDANDPLRLARFWAEALRWEVDSESRGEAGGEIGLLPTDGTRFRIVFRPVPNTKTLQNRIHLDLTTESVDDQLATVARLLERGGCHVDIGQRTDEGHVVLADPEGNELCVLEPGNSFLANAGRLGAINCDGTRRVGVFWSEALGWPLVWDQDEETAIRAPDLAGPLITWSGPPLMPKLGKNRLHLEVVPIGRTDQRTEVDRLVALGATRAELDPGEASRVFMADPDDNEFCVVDPRHRELDE